MFSIRRLVSILPALSAGLTCVAAAAFPFALNGQSIVSRQSTLDPSDIPTQCQSACNPFVDATNECAQSDDSCFCTEQVNESLQQCYDCVLGLIPDPDQSTIDGAQSGLSQFEQACNNENFGLASLTVSAATPTGGASTDSGISSLGGSSAPTSVASQTDSDESTQISGPSSVSSEDQSSTAPAGPTSAPTRPSTAGAATTPVSSNTQSSGPAATTQTGISGAAYSYGVVNAAVLVLVSGAVALLV